MGRHLQAGLGGRSWVFKLTPYRDELLSSFLIRSAHVHGMSPHRFCRVFIPGVQIWTRDIDMSATQSTLEYLAAQAGLDVSDCLAMTLLPLMGSKKASSYRSGQAWINAIGIYHRSRKRFGLQYCPYCLSEAPAFVRAWRLTYVVACEQHRCFLQDRCRSCERPLSQHRRGFDITRCHHCGAALSQAPGAALPDVNVINALRVQHAFERWASDEKISFGRLGATREDFFAGAMIIVMVVKEKMRSHSWLRGEDSEHDDNCEQLRLAPAMTRAKLCSLLFEALSDWPSNFLQLARACGMTQVGMRHRGEVPLWLAEAVSTLPERLRPRHAFSAREVGRRVRAIEALGGEQCRSNRAELLISAAGGRL